MQNVTVSVPDELREKMRRFKNINWSDVARRAFSERIRQEEMIRAARGIDELRRAIPTPEWSGAREIRRWRDRSE